MRGAEAQRNRTGGFTLIEVMVAVAALMMMLTLLYTAAFAMSRSAATQDSLIMLNQESRQAMQTIVRNLRQAQADSIQALDGGGNVVPIAGAGPVTNLRYRRVADVNGNGVALNADMSLGVTQRFQLTRDLNDANGDGLTITQLVRLDQNGNVVEVLANHISPPVATADVYNAPNGGLIFQNIGGDRLQVTLILRHRPDASSPMMVLRLDEVVSPRN